MLIINSLIFYEILTQYVFLIKKYAWEIANELLQRQTDVDSCYFGAQMIRHKILFSFHELPTDAVISLHTSLMQQLSKINKETDNIIVTQVTYK